MADNVCYLQTANRSSRDTIPLETHPIRQIAETREGCNRSSRSIKGPEGCFIGSPGATLVLSVVARNIICVDCLVISDQNDVHISNQRVNPRKYRGTSIRLGPLGFALAKGLIRGLVDRYPDPSLTTRIN